MSYPAVFGNVHALNFHGQGICHATTLRAAKVLLRIVARPLRAKMCNLAIGDPSPDP